MPLVRIYRLAYLRCRGVAGVRLPRRPSITIRTAAICPGRSFVPLGADGHYIMGYEDLVGTICPEPPTDVAWSAQRTLHLT